MTFPTDWTRIAVSGTYLDNQGNPLTGFVRFDRSPNVAVALDGVIVQASAIVATLDATGSFTVQIPSTDDPDISPTGWTWRVREQVSCGETYYIDVPYAGGPINLASVPRLSPTIDYSTSASALTTALASTLGAGMIGTLPGLGTSQPVTVQDRLLDTLSIMQFIPTSLRALVRSYTCTTDLTSYIMTAIYAAVTGGYELVFPPGIFPITNINILSSDVLLTSRRHIVLRGSGSFDPRSSTAYRGTVFQQIAGTTTAAMNVQGDITGAGALRGVRLIGFTILTAAANVSWGLDTRNLTGAGCSIEDVLIYVQNLAGSGFRAVSNWSILYRDITVYGVNTGSDATGTGISIYGDNTYGVTNMTVGINLQVSKTGRGIQLGHFDEVSLTGTTHNVILMGGQVDTCALNGVVFGFCHDSQVISKHVEQCKLEGWLFGNVTAANPRQLKLIGCSSFRNGATGPVYDMSIVRGLNIDIDTHLFDDTDNGVTITASSGDVDNITLRKCWFSPKTAPGTVAINNPAGNVTRIISEDTIFQATYTTFYARVDDILVPKREYGYASNTTNSATLTIHPGQTYFRLTYTNPTTITTVVNSAYFSGDVPALQVGQTFRISSSNGNVTISNSGSFSLPAGNLTLEQNVIYVFEYQGSKFRWISQPSTVTATTTQFTDKTHAVNTNGKVIGRIVPNTTNNKTMWATGVANTDLWQYADGSGSITPV